MLKKLYDLGYFNYQRFIIENSKRLSLSCEEAMVLINILNQYQTSKRMNIQSIVASLNMTVDMVQNTLSILMERGFYEIFISYDDGLGEESISLDGFFKKCEGIILSNAIMPEDELHVVISYLTEKLNRVLTSSEIDIITSLVMDDRYNLDNFKAACEAILEKKRLLTIKAIAQALANHEEPSIKPAPGFVKEFMKAIK